MHSTASQSGPGPPGAAKRRLGSSASRSALRALGRTALHRVLSAIALYRVRTREPIVHLTFDDGPHAENTPELLRILREFDARATFFVIGREAERPPEIISGIRAGGHGIGAHTLTHRSLTGLRRRDLLEEIDGGQAAIAAAGGGTPRLLRPPWGKYDLSTLFAARRRRIRLALWSHDSQDSRLSDPRAIVVRLSKTPMPRGSVLLLHDDYAHTVAALPGILALLRERGLRSEPLPGSVPTP